MGDTARQLTYSLHLLGLGQGFLRMHQVVDIGRHAKPPDDLATRVADRAAAGQMPAITAGGGAQAVFDLVRPLRCECLPPAGLAVLPVLGLQGLLPAEPVRRTGRKPRELVEPRVGVVTEAMAGG